MFKDYYAILQINIDTSSNEIKKAYKEQAIRWHPDKNPGIDTTEKMQDINEAYLILNDAEARDKYNIQYRLYKQFELQQRSWVKSEEKQATEEKEGHKEFKSEKPRSEFTADDDVLNRWMSNARKQAKDLAKQTLEDYKNITISGLAGAGAGCGFALYGYIISGIILTIIIFLIKTCNS